MRPGPDLPAEVATTVPNVILGAWDRPRGTSSTSTAAATCRRIARRSGPCWPASTASATGRRRSATRCSPPSRTRASGPPAASRSGRQALIETISLWSPPGTLAYDIVGLPPVVAGVSNRWDLAPDADGTFVTLTSVIDPGASPKGKVAAKVLQLPLGKASDSMLDGLAAHLASSTAS